MDIFSFLKFSFGFSIASLCSAQYVDKCTFFFPSNGAGLGNRLAVVGAMLESNIHRDSKFAHEMANALDLVGVRSALNSFYFLHFFDLNYRKDLVNGPDSILHKNAFSCFFILSRVKDLVDLDIESSSQQHFYDEDDFVLAGEENIVNLEERGAFEEADGGEVSESSRVLHKITLKDAAMLKFFKGILKKKAKDDIKARDIIEKEEAPTENGGAEGIENADADRFVSIGFSDGQQPKHFYPGGIGPTMGNQMASVTGGGGSGAVNVTKSLEKQEQGITETQLSKAKKLETPKTGNLKASHTESFEYFWEEVLVYFSKKIGSGISIDGPRYPPPPPYICIYIYIILLFIIIIIIIFFSFPSFFKNALDIDCQTHIY